jgi:hypothetical protein
LNKASAKEGEVYEDVYARLMNEIKDSAAASFKDLSGKELYNQTAFIMSYLPYYKGKFGEELSKELGLGKVGMNNVSKSDYQFKIDIKKTEVPFTNKKTFNPDECHYFEEDGMQKVRIVDTKVGDGNFDPDQKQNYLLLRDNYKKFIKDPVVEEAPTIEFLYLPNGKKPAKEAAEEALKKMEKMILDEIIDKNSLKDKHIIIKYMDTDGVIKEL